MEIIPVIDLMNGQVVHARFGERQHYQPIQSSLCASSDPLAIVQALLEVYPFKKLYIADLDAIQDRGHHHQTILLIQQRHPELELWLDAGIYKANDLEIWLDIALHMVIGSEKLTDIADFETIKSYYPTQNYLLSLDFTARGFAGPDALLHQPQYWPQRLIAMTLNKVGSNAGPDEQFLQRLIHSARGRAIYAAGGVRSLSDLQALRRMGVTGVLVASALHAASLTGNEIAFIA